jgi:23S rRNA (uridine2552-2'-O)-methyltransferase
MTGRRKKPPGPGRGLATRVRTAKRRKASSTRWLRRQLNDPYVAAAAREGYRSRAAYKLIELDDRFGFLKRGRHVLDLGAAPGGWSQVAAERVGAGNPGGGTVLAVDRSEMDPVPGVDVVVLDFLDEAAPAEVKSHLGGRADVVLSDMAPSLSGHAKTDHLRIVALVEAAYDLAKEILAPGGSFVAKVFQGGTEADLLADMKRRFASVRHAKPPASRAESAETFVVAMGFRGDGD